MSAKFLHEPNKCYRVTLLCVGEMKQQDGKLEFVCEDRFIKSNVWIMVAENDLISSYGVGNNCEGVETYVQVGNKYYGLSEGALELKNMSDLINYDTMILAELQHIKKEISELKSKIENVK